MASENADERLANKLLRGDIEPDSEEEREAHRALARMFHDSVRNKRPLNPAISMDLGYLLDPDHPGECLRLVLRPTPRREGRPPDPNELAIAVVALNYGRHGNKFAQKVFGVSAEKVKRAKKKHRETVGSVQETSTVLRERVTALIERMGQILGSK